MRAVAPVHKHLEFVLILNQEHGGYSHKTIVRAKREDYHSTIFAQLDAGEYHLKFAFVSDAALLQLPCQTMQLELAIMGIERAKARAAMIKESKPTGIRELPEKLKLDQLLLKSPRGPLTMYKPAAVGWRHVEPGMPPYVDQSSLYVEILNEFFEIAEDDKAGLVVELQSDFLLSGVNVAISNV